MLAARCGLVDGARLLCCHGADPTAIDEHGKGVLAYAAKAEGGAASTMRKLLKTYAVMTPAQMLADSRLHRLAARLLRAGVLDPNAHSPGSPLPVQIARGVNKEHDLRGAVCPDTRRLFTLASGPWRPAAHHLFGPAVDGWVWQALLIQKRLGAIAMAAGEDGGAGLVLWLPPEMWMHVRGFMKQGTVTLRSA